MKSLNANLHNVYKALTEILELLEQWKLNCGQYQSVNVLALNRAHVRFQDGAQKFEALELCSLYQASNVSIEFFITIVVLLKFLNVASPGWTKQKHHIQNVKLST